MKKLLVVMTLSALIVTGCQTAPEVKSEDVSRITKNVTSLVLRFCYDNEDRKKASDTLYGLVVGVRSMTGMAAPTSNFIEANILAFAGGNEKWRSVASFIALFGNNLDAVAEGLEAAAASLK